MQNAYSEEKTWWQQQWGGGFTMKEAEKAEDVVKIKDIKDMWYSFFFLLEFIVSATIHLLANFDFQILDVKKKKINM